MGRLLSHRAVQIVLLLALLGLAVGLRLQDPPFIERLRHLTFDAFNRLQPRAAGDQTVIVDIDEASIHARGQWPWPRPLMADMVKKLDGAGARAIVFDVVFAEPDRTSPPVLARSLPQAARILAQLPDHDDIFAAAVSGAGNVVMGFVGANQVTTMKPLLVPRILNSGRQPAPQNYVRSMEYFTTSLPNLMAAAAGNGSFTPLVESDGIVRRLPLLLGLRGGDGRVGDIYPSLALEAVRVALGKKVITITSHTADNPEGLGIKSVAVGDVRIPTDDNGVAWVYYTGHRRALYVPAVHVLDGSADMSRFKDKIVFIGTSAIGLLDLRASPFKADLPGVEIHAEMAEQILNGQFMRRPNYLVGAELLATAAISLVIIFLAPFVSTFALAVMAFGIAGGGFLLGFHAYQSYGLLVDPIYPALVVAAIFIISSVLTNLRSEGERRAVRQAFSHYISPVLMEELSRDPARLRLGGEVREISVLFSDIRNFTTVSEGMDPAELISVMNDFLTPMSSCVLDTRGTIDKYIGDAMMAFWNAPLDDADHARHACHAALGMTQALGPVNADLEKRAAVVGREFRPLRAGIGVHTGYASVGNMGSRQRFAYSALGDSVNVASRLEGQTKTYGVSILISDVTFNKAPEMAALELDRLVVKGRKGVITIYALLGDEMLAATAAFAGWRSAHDAMLVAYRARRWNDAAAQCITLGSVHKELAAYYETMAARCGDYTGAEPDVNWDGVFVAVSK